MNEIKIILNNFLSNYEGFRSYVDNLDFKGEINPLDGVLYPNISYNIPQDIDAEITAKLEGLLGGKLKNKKMFMRLSINGDKPPHAAHNDVVMGQFTFMLYLTREEYCRGGTSFVSHKDLDMRSGVNSEEEGEVWRRDTNKREKWNKLDTVKMESNKALLFNSNLMHWAESPYSFGDSAEDGRLLLICFFDL